MASWRDRLKEIDLDAFRDSGWADKSAISDKRGAFGSFDTFVSLSGNTEEVCATGKPTRQVTPRSVPLTATKLVDPATDEPAQLREWRAGIARIDRDRPPKGFPATDWHHLHRDAGPFLATWGVKAIAFGWSTLDVFGVHRIAPAANYSAMGLVPLLRGSSVVAMTTDTATIRRDTGAHLTFRRCPHHPAGCAGVGADVKIGAVACRRARHMRRSSVVGPEWTPPPTCVSSAHS